MSKEDKESSKTELTPEECVRLSIKVFLDNIKESKYLPMLEEELRLMKQKPNQD
jgi:hypothetical protein